MDKNKRSYIMYLEDIQLSMSRLSEYIEGLDFQSFIIDCREFGIF